MKSMLATARQEAETAVTRARDDASSQMDAATASSVPAPAPVAPSPQSPATMLPPSAPANGSGSALDSAAASLSATSGVLQKQAEELLTRYSGELTTLKSGVLAVKTYVDQHPEILPETAKVKYQQLTAMVPQLESLVGTLKDYRSVDLTTLVPKLQNDFATAKSLYGEVRGLLPEKI